MTGKELFDKLVCADVIGCENAPHANAIAVSVLDSALADARAAGYAESRDPPGTFAWLVEDINPSGVVGDSHKWPNGSPLYWCGSGWTHDPCEAIRFARCEDAQKIAELNKRTWPGKQVEAREHGFAPFPVR